MPFTAVGPQGPRRTECAIERGGDPLGDRRKQGLKASVARPRKTGPGPSLGARSLPAPKAFDKSRLSGGGLSRVQSLFSSFMKASRPKTSERDLNQLTPRDGIAGKRGSVSAPQLTLPGQGNVENVQWVKAEKNAPIDPALRPFFSQKTIGFQALKSTLEGRAFASGNTTQARGAGKAFAETLLMSQDPKVAWARQDLLLSNGGDLKDALCHYGQKLLEKEGGALTVDEGKGVKEFFEVFVNAALFELSEGKMESSGLLTIGDHTYKPLKEAGKGGFGAATIYVNTTDHTDQILVKRCLKQDEQSRLEMADEIKTHAALGTGGKRNVIQLIAPVRTEKGELLCALEYAPYGDGDRVVERVRKEMTRSGKTKVLAEHGALHLALDVAKALKQIQGNGGVHYDFRPSNMFFGKGENGGPTAKVGDFGTSSFGDTLDMAQKPQVDNPRFKAPEALDPDVSRWLQSHRLNPKKKISLQEQKRRRNEALEAMGAEERQKFHLSKDSDLWSLGFVLFEFYGENPFVGTESIEGKELNYDAFSADIEEKILRFQEGQPAIGEGGFFTTKSTGNPGMDAIINGLIRKNPKDRMPIDEVITKLEGLIEAHKAAHQGLSEERARAALMGKTLTRQNARSSLRGGV